jgi:GNAT superfamily N-acetyltransferase
MTDGSSASYTVRQARDDELELLAAIEHLAGELFRTTTHAYVMEAPALSIDLVRERHGAGGVWVAVTADDEVVGFAVAGDLGGEAYLEEIDVDPRHGRRGLGRRLIDAVVEWACTERYATLVLSTFEDVAWNAPFYARVGFEPVPEAELTPAMVETRRAEAKAGLLVERRVFMRVRVLPRLQTRADRSR